MAEGGSAAESGGYREGVQITHVLARPMLAGMFIVGGADAVQHPEPKADKADKVAPAIAEPLHLPDDPVTLVRLNGAVQVLGGVLLALGKFRRLAAAGLAASLLPTTLAGHRFWEETDEGDRRAQQIHFLKNLAMLGGLILAATDTDGKPSLGWRARRAAGRVGELLPVGA